MIVNDQLRVKATMPFMYLTFSQTHPLLLHREGVVNCSFHSRTSRSWWMLNAYQVVVWMELRKRQKLDVTSLSLCWSQQS